MGKKTKDAPKLFSCSKCGNMFSEDELTASKCPECKAKAAPKASAPVVPDTPDDD